MNYIILDMEWNQPVLSDKAIIRNGICMKNEIVQIGAVKLNSDKKITDKFISLVKPDGIKAMNKNVAKLTGITDEILKNADGFETVLERFKVWCGEDYVILIWGYDDIRILVNNIKFHGLDVSWLPSHYNAQIMFYSQNKLEKRQYSLSFAKEFCNIGSQGEFHDALNDAEYTALVCATLDLEGGISSMSKGSKTGELSVPKDSGLIKKCKFKPVSSKVQIWENGRISRPACPFCTSKMTFEKAVPNGKFRYNIKAHCPEHGNFAVVIRLSPNQENTYNVYRQIYFLNEETEKMFKPTKASRRSGHKKRRRTSKSKSE